MSYIPISVKQFFDKELCEKLEKRIREVIYDMKAYGVRFQNGRKVFTGYSYGEFYDWDLYFENLFLSYLGISEFCRSGVEMFLDRQLKCGFIPRTLGIVYPKPRHHFKPFLAQISLLGSRQVGDFRWLKGKYYERLKKYLDYWFWFCDLDKNGLCVWDGSDHSGMDNQIFRLGYDGVMSVEGVDLNCYLVRELQAIAEIALELGYKDDAERFTEQMNNLARLIDDIFWDEIEGFYYDRDERRNKLIKVRSIAGLLPLWTGLIPENRAKRLVYEHLLNSDEFWLPYPVATWSKSDPNYYQESKTGECTWMGATWIPTNYMIFHGLMRYGYKEVARELAYKTFEMLMLETATREYYNSETGSGQGLNPFWGWSTLGYVMPIEYELGYDPTDTKNKEYFIIKEFSEFWL